jgi:hypothetical protein
MELPTGLVTGSDGSTVVTYPRLQRRTSAPIDLHTAVLEVTEFPWAAYKAGLADFFAHHTSIVQLKGVWFTLTQLERNLYSYYSVANAFQDENTIRLDVPDRSNIEGGYGVFGAMVVDSLYVDFSTL